ncbi:hypothetical protein R1sor_002935 [Riccia sorocarpa]|uniref:Uncharacterized protein n=1 Tax=Riccia sorocarpa TaxID=122646 RepID=A0ABD3H0J3_9MARC
MEARIDGRVCKTGKSVRGSSSKFSSSEAAIIRHKKSTTRLYEPVPAHPDVDLIARSCKYEELSHIASVAFHDAAIADSPVSALGCGLL